MGSGGIPKKPQQSPDPGAGKVQEISIARPQQASPPTENVEKIREILFGSNIRDYERRFALIEGRLSKELAELKEETQKRLSALENSASREIEALNSVIEKERQERGEANEKLNQDVTDISNSLEKKARQIEDRNVRVERELRDQILASSRSASEELRAKLEELIDSLGRRADELREQKVDRATLAGLLNELAMRLNSGSGLPNLDLPKLEKLAHGDATE